MSPAPQVLACLTLLLPSAWTTGWGPWSAWSACLRTCGEGLQARRRPCLSPLQGCQGGQVSWRACGLPPCPAEASSWRDEQCSLHNNRALEGEYHLWLGAELPESPCSLDCQAEGGLLHRFLDRVEDGTRCGQGGLALCLAGECEEVGCDLELRSGEVLDQCGVCGGDGSSCRGPRYAWHQGKLPLPRLLLTSPQSHCPAAPPPAAAARGWRSRSAGRRTPRTLWTRGSVIRARGQTTLL